MDFIEKGTRKEHVDLCSPDGHGNGMGIMTAFLGRFHGTYAEICMKCDLNSLKHEDIRDFFEEFTGNATEEI